MPVPDITLVIIGRNESPNLPRCFKAVEPILHQFSSVLYVDSGSSDDSISIAKSSGVVDNIISFTSNYYTASLARTIGLSHVTTPFVQFLDGDMTLCPEWIPNAKHFLSLNPKCAVVHGGKNEYQSLDLQTIQPRIYNGCFRSDFLQGSYLGRTSALKESGFLDPRFPGEEERDLYVRLHHASWQVWYINSYMSDHYNFKARGFRYLLFSDVPAVLGIILLKSFINFRILSFIYVYRAILPQLAVDLLSVFFLLKPSFYPFILLFQLLSFAVYKCKRRPGYWLLWKALLLNIYRIPKLLTLRISFYQNSIPIVHE